MKLEKLLLKKKGNKFTNLLLSFLIYFFSCEPNLPTSPNTSPVIYSIPKTSVNENSYYSYQFKAKDEDEDDLYVTFSAPDWLSFSKSGLISGTAPEVEEDKTEKIKITVSDKKDEAVQEYNLKILNENTGGLTSKAKILSGVDLASIQEKTGTKIVFSSSKEFYEGDILLGGISRFTPNGLLMKVSGRSDDGKTIYTTLGSLDEAVDEAKFSLEKDLSYGTLNKFCGNKGVSLSKKNNSGLDFYVDFNNVVLFDKDGNLNTISDQINLSGNFCFSTSFNLDFEIFSGDFEKLVFENSTDCKSLLIASVHSNLENNFEKEIVLAEGSFSPFVAWIPTVPSVPIVIQPKMEIFAEAKLASSSELRLETEQLTSATIGLKYENSWSNLCSFENNFYFEEPYLSGEIQSEVSVGTRLNLLLYGFVGPKAELKGKIKFKSENFNWDLYGKLEALVGITPGILSKEDFNYLERIVLEKEELLAQGEMEEDEPKGKIAFIAYDNNDYDIYTINADGTNKKAVTRDNYWDICSSWHPTEDKIVYSTKVAFTSDDFDIYTINADGTNKTALTYDNPDAYSPSFSPDGSKLIYSANNVIYLMNLKDSSLTELMNDGEPKSCPSFSPNGEEIVFESSMEDNNKEIYVYHLKSRALNRLTNNENSDKNPSWSKDGNYISFASNRDGNWEIYKMNANGSNETNITQDPERDDKFSSWSPDGKYIVYASSIGSMNNKLFIINLETNEKTELIPPSSSFYNLSSPDWK